MYFRDVAGLEDLKTYLRRTAQTRQIAHAQLFAGEEGGGAFPLALAYARYLNCQMPTDTDACGHCPSCLKYDVLAHPDLFFVYPVVNASSSPTPSDDYIRQWREMLGSESYFTPADWLEYIKAGNSQPIIYSKEAEAVEQKLSFRIYEASYRVVMIWQPERMNEAMANKLLKLIEEPPEHTLFFMISSEPDKVLGTIRSRVKQTEFHQAVEAHRRQIGIQCAFQRGFLFVCGEDGMSQSGTEFAEGGKVHVLRDGGGREARFQMSCQFGGVSGACLRQAAGKHTQFDQAVGVKRRRVGAEFRGEGIHLFGGHVSSL